MHYTTAPGVLAEQVNGRVLLISADSSELLTLNPVGSVVWTALTEGMSTLEELVDAVTAAFTDAPTPTVADEVAAFLDELTSVGLVQVA